jgi:hypothetical protein
MEDVVEAEGENDAVELQVEVENGAIEVENGAVEVEDEVETHESIQPSHSDELDPDLEGVVDIVGNDGTVLTSEESAAEKKKRPKLQHVALTLWDTDKVHRDKLKRMQKYYKWCGVLEGRELCPDTGKPHLHVYIQTHWTKRKRITEVRNLVYG